MRVETIGNARLYLGDCRKILPTLTLADAAIVSDVPYGINYLWHGGGTSKGRHQVKSDARSKPIEGDGEAFDPAHLLHLPCLLFGADYFCQKLPLGGRWFVWDKRCQVIPPRAQSDLELIWCSEPGPRRMFYHMWDGMVRASEVGVKRQHPTQKPIALMKMCIEALACSPHLICDPYMGSGTTGVAATRLGRSFVGIEVEEKYFDIACGRIAEAQRQGDMFHNVAVR